MISPNSTTKNTDQVGVWFLPSRLHRLWPGTAPSRENAKVIREALVRHAIPQNSCPTVEMKITALAAAVVRELVKIGSAFALPVIADGWIAANVTASRRSQPITAE